jgi:hypothetical protein
LYSKAHFVKVAQLFCAVHDSQMAQLIRTECILYIFRKKISMKMQMYFSGSIFHAEHDAVRRFLLEHPEYACEALDVAVHYNE